MNMHKSILAPSQSDVSGVCSTKAVEMRNSAASLSSLCLFKLDSLLHMRPRQFLAEILSHLGGVDFGPFAHRGPPRLHRSSEAVPLKSFQPGVSLGLVTSCVVVTTDASTGGR